MEPLKKHWMWSPLWIPIISRAYVCSFCTSPAPCLLLHVPTPRLQLHVAPGAGSAYTRTPLQCTTVQYISTSVHQYNTLHCSTSVHHYHKLQYSTSVHQLGRAGWITTCDTRHRLAFNSESFGKPPRRQVSCILIGRSCIKNASSIIIVYYNNATTILQY